MEIIKSILKLILLILMIPASIVVITLLAVEYNLRQSDSPKYEIYEGFNLSELSLINGEWIYFKPINIKLAENYYAEAFRKSWQMSLLYKFPHRIRISNEVLQAYNSYAILRDDKNSYVNPPLFKDHGILDYENFKKYNEACDISDGFSFIPLKFYESRYFDEDKLEWIKTGISTSAVEMDESFIKKYSDERLPKRFFVMPFYKSPKEKNEFVAILSFSDEDHWYASLQNIGTYNPVANDPIIFHDELDKVDASKVEVLAIAGENLTELPEKLKECVSLKKLFIPFNKLRFTERDMEILTSLKNLEVLDIRYNEIANSPDPNLNALKELKNLRKVYLAGKNFGKDDYIPTVFAEMNLDLLAISNGYDIKFPDEYARSNSPKRINILYSVLSESEVKRSKIKSSKNRTWSLVESYIIPDKDIKLPQAN